MDQLNEVVAPHSLSAIVDNGLTEDFKASDRVHEFGITSILAEDIKLNELEAIIVFLLLVHQLRIRLEAFPVVIKRP